MNIPVLSNELREWGTIFYKGQQEGCFNPCVLPQDTLQTSPPGFLTSLQMFNRTYRLYSYRFVFRTERGEVHCPGMWLRLALQASPSLRLLPGERPGCWAIDLVPKSLLWTPLQPLPPSLPPSLLLSSSSSSSSSFFNSPVVRLHFFFCTYSLLPWKRFLGKWGRVHRWCRKFLGRLFCHVAPLIGSFREARPHHKAGDLCVALAGVHSSWTSSHQVRAFPVELRSWMP